jgi:hypothetical protein
VVNVNHRAGVTVPELDYELESSVGQSLFPFRLLEVSESDFDKPVRTLFLKESILRGYIIYLMK